MNGRGPALMALVGALVCATAAAPATLAAEDGDPIDAGLEPEKPLTVLLFHPDDGVDPLGFSAGGDGVDAFALRYGPLVAEKGRFDFPFFVADGVLPIEAIPDPSRPFASARASYDDAVQQREDDDVPAFLYASTQDLEGQVVVALGVAPQTDLASEDLHLRVALVEDHVLYQPPPGLTNGVTDHRFTVRAYADLGTVTGWTNSSRSFLVEDGWARDRLSVAAWLQQDAPSPRFAAREVVQATHVGIGNYVSQAQKGVLVEMLSATWCDPCLYGDRAIEDLAVDYGVATAGPAAQESRYIDLRAGDAWSVVAAAALGILVVAVARRRPHG